MICELGQDIIIPSIINKETGQRTIDIDQLILTCDWGDPVVPSPTHTWTKDGIAVIRGTTLGQRPVINNAFFRNTALFMIQPVPITVTNSLTIMVDFSAFNVSTEARGLLQGTSREDIRTYILDSIIGEWTCGIRNALGNDSKTSTLTGMLRAVMVMDLPPTLNSTV